jgi:RiboL-PSP-HEPN
MSRYSTAYGEFVQRCDEVLILVRRAAAIERSKSAFSKGKEIDALCRGALVLLSSHVEAYIKEVGESLLDAIYVKEVCRSKLSTSFFYYTSKIAIDRVRSDNDPEKISIETFHFVEQNSSIWQRTGALPRQIDADEFNLGFANPKFEKVKKYLARFGYTSLRHDINRTLKADALVVIGNLDQIVDIRNAIAHGEASATKTPSEVKSLVKSATIFCRTVDSGFGDWCKMNVCSIR